VFALLADGSDDDCARAARNASGDTSDKAIILGAESAANREHTIA
jgi:hypothetical protein